MGKHRPDRKPVIQEVQRSVYPIPDFITRLSKDLKLSKTSVQFFKDCMTFINKAVLEPRRLHQAFQSTNN